MNRPSHKQALWTGLGILLLVNALALGGAAWNRSGIDSQLKLSERELRAPYVWQGDSEDSGKALMINWRAQPASRSEELAYLSPYTSYGADPGWLDAAKLASLGFNVTPPPSDAQDRDWRRRAQRVTLVLEFDGRAYAKSLALSAADAEQSKAKAVLAPKDEALASRAKESADALHENKTRASRLFAVDAGLDPAKLRMKYADRRRYLLVPALVQMYWLRNADRSWHVAGSIERLLGPQIHLSRGEARALAAALGPGNGPGDLKPIEVEVAFGRRLEPWIVSARVR